MNKKIIALFFAATIGLNSCTEVLEPNVDYGDKTYINDYLALVSAINDLSKSFGDRIEALNTLLKNGMAELKLSIDANTGAITVLSQTTQQGLGDINKTLFDGFSPTAGPCAPSCGAPRRRGRRPRGWPARR